MNTLEKIVAYKKHEVAAAKANAPISAMETLAREMKPKRFAQALEKKASSGFALIAEIKKASPSKGLIREDFNPAEHARAYAKGGAACLSVLTDGPGFQGDPAFLRQAREAVPLPILRKDFFIDPYQIIEARAWGADCILLIMACLSDEQAGELFAAAKEWQLDVIVEVHDSAELERASKLTPKLLGINNRNLKTFATDLETTRQLAALAPPNALLISESGIRTHQDLKTLAGFGAKAFLVGESLMRQGDVEAATKALLSPPLRTA